MTAPILSRPLRITDVSPLGGTVEIVADAEERAALAACNALPRLDRLTATLDVRPFGRGGIIVSGTLKADICQTCVVSLDDFDSHMEEPVDVRFVPESSAEASAHNDNDPPDVIVGGQIDLGVVVAEFFALGLDPYPRKPGAAFTGHEESIARQPSPFAALKAVQRPDESSDGET